MELKPLWEWFPGQKNLGLILGPCSAETEEQVLSTAHALKCSRMDIGFFRAGVWKPRTRPGSFQGQGKRALEWLCRVREKYGFPIAVEVARAEHVEDCLRYGLDAVWIGARTVVNPFSVQEIATTLEGVDIPVFIKNPIVPDLGLWIGAVERLYQSGIRKLVAIHRGFSTLKKQDYRFSPEWSIPVELKRSLPKLPIFSDPSHMAGKRKLLEALIQKVLDFGVDGLMVEVHIHPPSAWSDSEQQVSPEEIKKILDRVEIKQENTDNQSFSRNMEFLRKEIDTLDKQLLEILATRMHIVEQIREQKAENKVVALQMPRWREILQSRIESGERLGLTGEFVKELLQIIHEEAIQRQMEILAKNKLGEGRKGEEKGYTSTQ